jgi:hypothetical protein
MNKRDLSVSMQRANVVVLFIAVPIVILQFWLFGMAHPGADQSITWNYLVFLLIVMAGIVVHEAIHGITWALAGRKPWSSIKFGFQVKTLTPYCHINEPIEINAYRVGAFMPGLLVGVLPFVYSLINGDTNWFWFSLVHISAAGGDLLVLWLIRGVKAESLVEDHPTQAGCYVLESQI